MQLFCGTLAWAGARWSTLSFVAPIFHLFFLSLLLLRLVTNTKIENKSDFNVFLFCFFFTFPVKFQNVFIFCNAFELVLLLF